MESILVAPDLDRKIRMEVNVLDYTMGRVLSMECDDRRWRPVFRVANYGLYFIFSFYFSFLISFLFYVIFYLELEF